MVVDIGGDKGEVKMIEGDDKFCDSHGIIYRD